MINPDFLTIAKGYCIDGQRVSKRDDLDDAVKKMLDHNGPYLLEVKVEKEGNVFPMVPAGCSVSEIRLE
jgi:acetolactate synthase-1/2/3 large subunit